MKKITASNKNTLKEKIDQYLTLVEQKRELDKQIKALKDEFLKGYFEKEIDENELKYLLEADEYKLQLELVVQNRFDTTSFKKDHPKYYEAYLKPVTNKVFKPFKEAK